jgi:hypothetical protein
VSLHAVVVPAAGGGKSAGASASGSPARLAKYVCVGRATGLHAAGESIVSLDWLPPLPPPRLPAAAPADVTATAASPTAAVLDAPLARSSLLVTVGGDDAMCVVECGVGSDAAAAPAATAGDAVAASTRLLPPALLRAATRHALGVNCVRAAPRWERVEYDNATARVVRATVLVLTAGDDGAVALTRLHVAFD